MKKTALFSIALVALLISISAMIENRGTVSLQKVAHKITSYPSFAIVQDSLPKLVSTSSAEVFFHLEVPDGDYTTNFSVISAPYPDLTPFLEIKNQDTAHAGLTAYAILFNGLTGGTRFAITPFANTVNSGSYTPWQLFWVVTIDRTGVPSIEQKENTLSVFPNPIVSEAKVNCFLWNNTVYHLYDLTGREVSTFHAAGEETTFSRGNLPAGNYILEGVNSGIHMKITQKITIQ